MKKNTTAASKQLSLHCMLQVTPIWHTDTQLYFHFSLSGHTSIPGVINQTGPHLLEKNNNKNCTNKSSSCRQPASLSILKAYCEMLPGIGRCHYLKEYVSAPGRAYTYPADATENMQKIFSLYESFPCREESAACLDFSVHIKNIWNAAEYGLDLFLSKDWSPKLSFLLQWNLK